MVEATNTLPVLIAAREHAMRSYFAHSNPGNLTPAQQTAFQHRESALFLLLKAAQIELDAELSMQKLLMPEAE